MGYRTTITPNWGICMDGLMWGYGLDDAINSVKKIIEVSLPSKTFMEEFEATYLGECSSNDNQEISMSWDEMILNGIQ